MAEKTSKQRRRKVLNFQQTIVTIWQSSLHVTRRPFRSEYILEQTNASVKNLIGFSSFSWGIFFN
jgi:hypothetical protein